MASPPEAHNAAHGHVYGQLLQVRDVHGDVTVNTPQAPPEVADVSLDPPRLATAVRGRAELLTTLRAAMVRGAPAPHVLTGPGGFGKTTVAAALAEHARAKGWTVFWVRPNSIGPSMLEAAIELGGSRQEAEGVKDVPRQAARWAWRHLDSATRPWLLVIDNADRPEELDPEHRPGQQRGWMRSSPGGFVLVTSRMDDPALWAPATLHRLRALEPADAAVTLADHAGVGELPGATELAERLAGVPLALSLAGRILATHQVLFPDAWALLDRLEDDVTRLDELAGPQADEAGGGRGLLSGVWDLSLRLLAEQHPHAVPLLRVLSLLGTQGQAVPLRRLPLSELAGGVLDDPENPLDEVSFSQGVNALVTHGLVRVVPRGGERALLLHPLVAETTLSGLEEKDTPLLDQVEALLHGQSEHDPLWETFAHSTLLDQRARRLPPDREFFDGPAASIEPLFSATHLRFSRLLILTGRREEAEMLVDKSVSFTSRVFGPFHETTLQRRHQFAEVRLDMGRTEEAETEYRELVELGRIHHGPEHEVTLEARFMLALIALRREEWEEAAGGFRVVMEAGENGSDPENRRVLLARENLAYLSMRRGDHSTAEREFLAIRQIRSRDLGEHHFLTAQADYYLGRVAFEAGEHAKAREPFARCLAVRERALGTDHPDTDRVREWLDRVGGPPTSSE